MSSSDLHKRLEHLISYSSGLTFIKTGAQALGQSAAIDMLLAEQNENLELAVIKAHPGMGEDDVLQQLAQQLFGPNSPHPRQSVAELLHPISQFTDSLLICIAQGENLPEGVLQECWQLVSSQQVQANQTRINVLVFAESDWAEQTNKRLPSNGPQRPIMLNMQAPITARPAATQGSELDQLINQKRQAFAQRLLKREAPAEITAPSPVLRKTWFLALIGLIFVVIFGAMLLMQYPQLLSNIFASDDHKPPIAENSGTASQKKDSVTEPNSSMAETPDLEEQSAKPELKSHDIAKPKQDALVSTWQDETARIDQARSSPSTLQNAAENVNLAKPSPSKPASLKPAAKDTADVQVGALPSLYPGQSLTEQNKLKSKPNQITDANQQPLAKVIGNIRGPASREPASREPSSREPASRGPDNRESSVLGPSVRGPSVHEPSDNYDEQALLGLSAKGYVLQIIGLASRQAMQDYILNNQLKPYVWTYKTRRYGNDWYVLLNNQYYPSLAAAVRAVGSLPQSMRQATPFPKNVDKVHQEIRKPE